MTMCKCADVQMCRCANGKMPPAFRLCWSCEEAIYMLDHGVLK